MIYDMVVDGVVVLVGMVILVLLWCDSVSD